MTMSVLSSRYLLTLVLTLCLITGQGGCHGSSLSPGHDRTLATEPQQQHHHSGHRQPTEGSGGCEEGWLYTHHHCLLDTGLGAGQEARGFCSRHGAEEARGICIKQSPDLDPPSLDTPAKEEEDSQGASLTSSSGAKSPAYVCPSGWTQYEEFCFFRPGTVPKICALLGADYLFNYCVTRVPHQLPIDFMQAVKRLDGSDYDMHRDSRACCCAGWVGLC